MNTLQQNYDVIWYKELLCVSVATTEISWLPWRRIHLIRNNHWQKKHGHKVQSLSPLWPLTHSSWLTQFFFHWNSRLQDLHPSILSPVLLNASLCEYVQSTTLYYKSSFGAKHLCWIQCHWSSMIYSNILKSSGEISETYGYFTMKIKELGPVICWVST